MSVLSRQRRTIVRARVWVRENRWVVAGVALVVCVGFGWAIARGAATAGVRAEKNAVKAAMISGSPTATAGEPVLAAPPVAAEPAPQPVLEAAVKGRRGRRGRMARALPPVDAAAMLETPPLRVQLLNGKTGRPLVNHKLVLMTADGRPGSVPRPAASVMTDVEGFAPLPGGNARNVMLFPEGKEPCSRHGVRAFAMNDVRAMGVVSENSCRPRITLYKQPGTLVFFVRDESLMEKMRR